MGIDIELGKRLGGKDGRELVDIRFTSVGCCGSCTFIGIFVGAIVLEM